MSEDAKSSPTSLEALIHDWNHGPTGPKASSWPRLEDVAVAERLRSGFDVDLEARVALARSLGRMGVDSAELALEHEPEPVFAALLESAPLRLQVRVSAPPTAAWSKARVELVLDLPSDLDSVAAQVSALAERAASVVLRAPLARLLAGGRGRDLGRWRDAGLTRVMVEDRVEDTPERVHAAVTELCAGWPEGLGLGWVSRDRGGLGVANALAARAAGAESLSAALLGEGGYAAMELLLVNLELELGSDGRPLDGLVPTCLDWAERLGRTIPVDAPLIGSDAFRTATGVHAAAIVKALAKGSLELADLVYSGVPAGRFGRTQSIDIGPMSGTSNVRHWLESQGIEPHPELVASILARAKSARRVLDEDTVQQIAQGHRGEPPS